MAGLYPNTPFTDGTVFTPDLADLAFEAPIFDDQPQYKGHRARILDSELSNTAGQIKDRVAKVTDNLKCAIVSGLTVGYTSGSVRLPNGNLQAIAANQIVVANNATSFIWVNASGVVVTGLVPPVIRVLLARVTTVSGNITILEDLRSGAGFPDVTPVVESVRSFGGRGDEGAFVATNGQDLDQGEYYFSSFTVPAGISITINKLARIYVSGDVDIAGTITVPPWVSGGGDTAYLVVAGGLAGGEPGSGFGGGSGELPKEAYNHLVSPVGSGGGAGYLVNNSAITQLVKNANGGKGGGCLWIEAAGTINVTGTINAVGESGVNGQLTVGGFYIGGSGGGSGGLVLLRSLKSITVTGTATINVSGGKGGDGFRNNSTSTVYVEPGSGGGGGRIVLFAPTINTTGATLNLSGGSVGTLNNTTATSGGQSFGGVGGSYGGLGGNQLPYASGSAGVVTYRYFTPVG